MALLFFDNFGGYTAAQASMAWGGGLDGNVLSLPTISQSGGFQNGPYIEFQNSASAVSSASSRTFSASATWVLGLRIYPIAPITTSSVNIISLYDSATVQMSLRYNGDGTLSVVRGSGTAVTGGTSVLALTSNTWQWVEMKVTIANSISAGTCVVKVDGVTWITVTTSEDLQATSNATANQIILGKIVASSVNSFRVTDVVIDNGTTLYGDSTISILTSNADGTTQEFDPVGGSTHYLLVDDATHDTDSTYLESSVLNEIELFNMSALTVIPVTIHAVAPWNAVRKSDGGPKDYCSVIRSGASNFEQATLAAVDSYIYDIPITTVDPNTAAAWTTSNVNAVQVGVKVKS